MKPLRTHSARVIWHGRPVYSWAAFHRDVKRPGEPLLATLDDFPDSILVAGCQRSGTTALTRMIKGSGSIEDIRYGADDELDDALVLAGRAETPGCGRRCFQTTYLNDRSHEYLEHDSFRLIWILREPRSVVRSMLYNWKRAALNRLYDACCRSHPAEASRRSSTGGYFGPSSLEKACASYLAKTEQTFALREALGDRMLILDYDELVRQKATLVREVCTFADIPFEPVLLDSLHSASVSLGTRLSRRAAERIDDRCRSIYRAASALRARTDAYV